MLADDGAAAGGRSTTTRKSKAKQPQLERETRKGEGPARESVNGNPPVDGRPPLAQIAEEDAAQTERFAHIDEED